MGKIVKNLKQKTLAYYQQLIHRINIYLELHVHEPFGLTNRAEYVHVSRDHLAEVFASQEQESIGAYFKRHRLEKSASLLQYTSLNLDEIAWRTGYSGKHALSKAFSQAFNLSPGSLRRRNLYLPDAANMIMDGIHSEEAYSRILRKDFTCNWRIVNLEGFSGVCSMIRYSDNQSSVRNDYSAYIQSVLEDTARLQGSDIIIKFFDAPNFTELQHFKAQHGILVKTDKIDSLMLPLHHFQEYALRPGRYLVFEISPTNTTFGSVLQNKAEQRGGEGNLTDSILRSLKITD